MMHSYPLYFHIIICIIVNFVASISTLWKGGRGWQILKINILALRKLKIN